MDITLNHVPVGSVVELGGDTTKRRLYLGEIKQGFAVLYRTKDDCEQNKPWATMVVPSTRVKNVQLPQGFDVENIVGWARGRMQ